MNGPGNKFLAGAVLAGDQHPAAGRSGDGNLGFELADRRTFADHLRCFAELDLEGPVLFQQTADPQSVLQGQKDFFQR